MRPLDESKRRWEETLKQSSTFADLQRAVKFNGPTSPCIAGSRSVCWKAFLLFQDASAANWSHVLLESRNTYSALREHYLKYIKHPEQLAQLSLDPLADDPDSPWNAARQDDLVRTEILQDVQRLPDEPFYHKESTQTLILDILFIYCKLNPEVGGYRQGMHELLAPLVYVIDQDAIDRNNVDVDALADPIMVEMLDSYYIEHDAFALFSKIMDKAKAFYEIKSEGAGGLISASGEQSAIVEKSKLIHEIALMRVDPELSRHLKNIEILPQIFLIRWIRLLFGREFPFDQLLVLWDTIFAFDPTLELIDLICVSMLIRIRWALLEADYSVALQLLLKYPAPQAPHGPHTFVDDAVYLRSHYNTLGGSSLIMKYTGRTPATPASSSRPSTPNFQGLSLRSKGVGTRSPLTSPSRFIQQPPSVEALFQGAAKGVIERGEKLGINQAVRDAMGEIRRNYQGFQEARKALNNVGAQTGAGGMANEPGNRTVAEMELRNKQLAAMLDDTISNLKALAAAEPSEEEKDKRREALETVAAKTQLVKVYLEDASLELPELDTPAEGAGTPSITEAPGTTPSVAEDEVMAGTDDAPDTTSSANASKPPDSQTDPLSSSTGASLPSSGNPLNHSGDKTQTANSSKPPDHLARPSAPIPTRSTLAQSSFSWMLEPDTTGSKAATLSSSSTSSSPAPSRHAATHRKQRSSNASRERNAFLFGEVTADPGGVGGGAGGGGEKKFTSDDIFGLEPISRKPKGKTAVRGRDNENLF